MGLTRETKARVTDGPFWGGGPVWTPDGRELYYAADELQITVDGGGAPRWDPREGERHLYLVRQENQVWGVDLSTEEKVAEPEPVILFETGKPTDRLKVMPDGERFLVRYAEQRGRPISVLLRGVEWRFLRAT